MWLLSTLLGMHAVRSAPYSNSSAPSSFTRLRFVNADPLGHRGRRMVAHKPRRRRLDAKGWELEGNLHTLGYFSADICIGSPQRKFDLIVDTGSSLTALPCTNCGHCGRHQHSSSPGTRYDTSSSKGAAEFSCSHPPAGMRSCRTCDNGKCGYGVSYTEGSSIRGHLVSDTVWFAHGPSRVGVKAAFGCQTYESGLFYSQVADGITGFSMGLSYGPTLFDYFRSSTHSLDIFSMCLSEEVGAMVLGGRLPAESSSYPWIPYHGGGSYSIDLSDLRIKGRSIGTAKSHYGLTIVDSGTTFMYLPPDAYRKVRDHFRSDCPWGDCSSRSVKGEYPDDYCYTMAEHELDTLSDFSLHFENGVSLPFGPRQYAYELRRGVWCLGIFDNGHDNTVIGGANMRNHEVIFDREHRRIAFVPSKCSDMHAGKRVSVLEGGYGLTGCDLPLAPNASPASSLAGPSSSGKPPKPNSTAAP